MSVVDPEAIKAAGLALFDMEQSDGDEFGVLLHCSDYVDDSLPIAQQILFLKAWCERIAEHVVRAYLDAKDPRP